jgi:hypothetical protein
MGMIDKKTLYTITEQTIALLIEESFNLGFEAYSQYYEKFGEAAPQYFRDNVKEKALPESIKLLRDIFHEKTK